MKEPIWHRVLRLHGPDPRADIRDEFAFHLEERIEALMAGGMTEAQAREEAHRRFGDIAGATATCYSIGSRRVSRTRWRERIATVGQDLVYAIRAMGRAPGFTLAVVATIGLGIGANTAVFSLLNALLFQPLDARNPQELVRIYTSEGRAQLSPSDYFGASSYADYADLRESRALAGVLAFMPLGAVVELDGTVTRAHSRIVSENYFTVLGRPLYLGGWTPGEISAAPLEVIVSHRFWSTALGGDPAVLGRLLTVNGRRVPIAGVTAPDFKGIEPATVDLYIPFPSAPAVTGRSDLLTGRAERSIRMLGRLAPGVSAESAEAALDATMKGLGGTYPESNAGRTITVRRAGSILPLEVMGDSLYPIAGLVFGATLVMLLISGVNVASVLLARAIRRRRELAVRLSLGAGPFRLVRQLVTESVVLALGASVLVVALVSLLPLLASWLGVPESVRPSVDGAVLGYAVAVAIGFGVFFGLGPAIAGMRSEVVEALRGSDAGARPAKARAQQVLVASQLALSMLLLLVGGALLENMDRQQRTDPGFGVDRLVVATFEDPTGIPDRERQRVFTRLAVERLGAIPGVTSVSTASMAPLTSDGMRSTIHVPGYTEAPDEDMEVWMVTAGSDYFRTLGIPMQRGRELTGSEGDTLPRVVVNRSMARRYWGERDPVGTFVRLGGRDGRPAEVIGVASDARFRSLGEAPVPMYVVQRSNDNGGTVLIRTSGEPSLLLLAVRGSMARSDVPLTLTQVRPMIDILHGSLAVTRAVSDTVLVIGLLALLLAAVGLYGVVSYVMASRTREFGIRIALGANGRSITRLVLGYGLRLALIGGTAGVLLGLGALRLISGMLAGTSRSPSLTAAAGLVLVLITLLACAIPARRAGATSPADMLRSD
jgi:predicted permease